jgi:hypothetical protein
MVEKEHPILKNQSHWKRLVSALLATTCCACSRGPRKATAEVDLPEVMAAFGCASSPKGDADEGCRVLRDFDTGDAFTSVPTTGVLTWIGPAHCSDPKMEASPGSLNWRVLHVQPGVGKTFTYGGNTKPPDPSSILPFKADFPSFAPSNGPGGHIVETWKGWLSDLQADRTPVPSAAQKTDFDFAKTPSLSEPFAAVRSDGKSIIVDQITFVRQAGRRVVAITAFPDEKGKLASACIAEMWPLP